MERAEKRGPIAGYSIGVQLAFGVDYLMRGAQVFKELVVALGRDQPVIPGVPFIL